MALFLRKNLFEMAPSLCQFKRFRGKINIRKPRPPHFERAMYLEITKPWYLNPKKGLTPSELCKGFKEEMDLNKNQEIIPLQKIIASELYQKIIDSKLVVFFHLNPIQGEKRNKAMFQFAKEGMLLKQYGRRTMQLAVENTPYETILDFYCSQNITLFCKEPNIKYVLKVNKKYPQMVLLAGIFEGRLVNKDDLIKYSEIPNITTAQAAFVQTLNSLGSQLVNQLNTHQTNLVANLEERIKQLKEEQS